MGWLRNPRTTQERRVNGKRSQITVDGYEVKIRAKRSQASLPCAWEDLLRSDDHHFTWKRHRKKQYKCQ